MGCCDRKGIMKFTRVHKAIGIIGAIALAVMGIGQTAEASSQTGASASYDGTTISLASGWGGAAVCAVTESGNYCFASQSAYQNWLTSLVATMPISSSPDTIARALWTSTQEQITRVQNCHSSMKESGSIFPPMDSATKQTHTRWVPAR
jgi:hypothetical protein